MTEEKDTQQTFNLTHGEPIKGFPELHWTGKRPYRLTQYYPAQLRETYGEAVGECPANGGVYRTTEGWRNKIFWGDNLQVMSHLLRDYRGQVDLIYIDPPFDSKADYKKKIEVRGLGTAASDATSFEEKQYGDIWTNDEYLQFMYERLTLMRELLKDTGSIYLHCDWHKSHHLRCLMDEVFGQGNFRNEIAWCYTGPTNQKRNFPRKHDTILLYTKSSNYTFNADDIRVAFKKSTKTGGKTSLAGKKDIAILEALDEKGKLPEDWWADIADLGKVHSEDLGYPTQKTEKLLDRIIRASSNPGDIVFDAFCGSGTTLAAAMKLGRRFLGADINLGAVQTTTKRLLSALKEEERKGKEIDGGTAGFEVYNVNNYDFFRNPAQARDILIEALEIQKFPSTELWDGELDGRMVKIMNVNRIATKADTEDLVAALPYKEYERRKESFPNDPVERITLVCMGHESDLKASLTSRIGYNVDIQIVDILRDKKDLVFKREGEADVVCEGGKLIIRAFYPLNLMQKLFLDGEKMTDWRALTDSVMIDWNYDGAVLSPAVIDVPEKGRMVQGVYDIPKDAGTIKVKITDLLSESIEVVPESPRPSRCEGGSSEAVYRGVEAHQ